MSSDPTNPNRVIDRGAARQRAERRVRECSGECRAYIKRDNGYVEQIDCKLCGRAICGLVELPKPIERYKADANTLIIKKGMVLRPLANHRPIRIHFDDGSAHDTEICADCLQGLRADDLEAIYCSDLHQFCIDEDRDGSQCPWHALADRTPTGFERVKR